ncbi:hypothetical protein BB561_006691 [Smittium simulii]|uniref:Uncharacterized protein n=1 Tax=Smittium simulii TaxID=133385 RepID=A0A2T9Y2I9_9FUNG|nr:hypothetical protein BB561_006691 [Smittium simulii]
MPSLLSTQIDKISDTAQTNDSKKLSVDLVSENLKKIPDSRLKHVSSNFEYYQNSNLIYAGLDNTGLELKKNSESILNPTQSLYQTSEYANSISSKKLSIRSLSAKNQLDENEFIKNIELATNAVYSFLNADYSIAESILYKGYHNDLIYFVECYATITLIKAAISFDKTILAESFSACTRMVDLVNQSKKKLETLKIKNKESQPALSWLISNVSNVSKIVSIPSSNNSFIKISKTSLVTIHLDLMCAEAYLLRSVANAILNGGLLAFLKDGWNIKKAYFTYKTYLGYARWCAEEGSQEAKNANKNLDQDFKSSVYLGAGIFNIVLSMLPQRLLKVFDFVGFVGNSKNGIEALKISSCLNFEAADDIDNIKNKFCYPYNQSYSMSVESFETARNQFTDSSETPIDSSKYNKDIALISNSKNLYQNNLFKDQTLKYNMRAEISALVLIFYHTILSAETGVERF